MEGLKPNFKGGPKSRLTDEQKEEIREALRLNPMSTKDVRLYIMDEYGIEYSDKQIHVILTKMGLHHSKPYPIDHRRPADAETVLKKDSKMLWTV